MSNNEIAAAKNVNTATVKNDNTETGKIYPNGKIVVTRLRKTSNASGARDIVVAYAKKYNLTTVAALDTREHRAALKVLCEDSKKVNFANVGALACCLKAQINRALHATEDEPAEEAAE